MLENIYAFSRFVDLQSSNLYSWSIRWWKLQLVVQVYTGEMAYFVTLLLWVSKVSKL